MGHVKLSLNMSDNWVHDSLISQKGKNDKKPRVTGSEDVAFQLSKQYEVSANQNKLVG